MNHGAPALRRLIELVDLSRRLKAVLTGGIETVDQALGLIGTWRQQTATVIRNAAIIELAESNFPTASKWSRGVIIPTHRSRYAATAWKHDRLDRRHNPYPPRPRALVLL